MNGQSVNPPGNLGQVVLATHVSTVQLDPKQMQRIIFLLVGSMALLMTGLGIVMPIFARRLGEIGGGVDALGWMTIAYGGAQFLLAPYMGSLADRLGRRPLVLVALAAFAAMNLAYLVSESIAFYIVIRAVGGALTAGLFPATLSIVADIVPVQQRAKWIGIVMGGYGLGTSFGPVIGGVLYDSWGFAAPFLLSAGLAALAWIAAAVWVPETRPATLRRRFELRQRRAGLAPSHSVSLWAALPRPLVLIGTLFFLDFSGIAAFTFIEPQMVFYVYEVLSWTSGQFGLVIGVYSLAMVIAQILLGQTSDRMGRKPVIMLGVVLNVTFYLCLAFVTNFWVILMVAVISGVGVALLAPAVSAMYLDVTPEAHRSRVVGMRESVLSLGSIVGPLLVIVASSYWTPQLLFMVAGLFVLFGALLTMIWLREPETVAEKGNDLASLVLDKRVLAAHAALQELVIQGSAVRESRLNPL